MHRDECGEDKMAGGVYIDDSGTPGSNSGSDFLPSSRKS